MFNINFDSKLSLKKECELKTDIKIHNIYNMLYNIIIGMFEYSNIPKKLNMDIVEGIKIYNGYCGISKINNELVACMGSFCGDIDNNGFGEDFTGTTLNGTQIKGKIDEDVVILRNNKTYTKDIDDIYMFALDICDVDNSIDTNVFFTQIAPLISVNDSYAKSKLDEWFTNRRTGVPFTITKNDIDMLDNKTIEVNQLFDTKDVDKLQYLDKHRDELLRRFFNQYGFAMSNSEKLAQQTEKEISVNEGQALIYPYQRLQCAIEDIKKVNDIFNMNIEVSFNKLLQNKFNKFVLENGGVNDDSI